MTEQPASRDAVTLTVFGERVVLEPSPGVFTPTPHGLFYAKHIRIEPGERVIDIGTGSGVLAIAAAKRGATVIATDVDERAVHAARENARRNAVEIDARMGSFFAGARGPFDVILANLPNEIVSPNHLATLDAAEARTFAGGKGGNEHLIAMMETAPAFMHARSRLYLGVHAMTDYHGTLRAALERYAPRLLDFAELPAKEHVLQDLEYYRTLDATGVIRLVQGEDGVWYSYGYVYELTLLAARASS